MNLVECHEIQVAEAVGHPIEVTAAIDAGAAVDVERAETDRAALPRGNVMFDGNRMQVGRSTAIGGWN